MSILSGINGYVAKTGLSGLNAIGKWDINPKSEMSEFASSATFQAMDRVPGNDDWDGTYNAYGNQPIIMPGDVFDFYGLIDDTRVVQGSAIADDFSMKLDVEGSKEIEHAVKLSCAYSGSNIPLTLINNNISSLYDPNVSNVNSATGCTAALLLPGSSTWYAMKDVRSMDLSIKCANKAYHSSSTYIVDPNTNIGRNWAGRLRGNMDLTFSIGCYALPAELIPLKKVYGVRLYVTPPTISGGAGLFDAVGIGGIPVLGTVSGGTFWEIRWGIFNTYSGIEVDRKTVNIIGATVNGALKNATNISSVATRGWIIKPDTTTWWPWNTGGVPNPVRTL